MRTYDVKVRLAGSRENEVRLSDVTAAEVLVLRLFHGNDAVEDIRPKGTLKVPHAEVRDTIWKKYVGATDGENLGGHMLERAKVLQSLFGPKHTPLPTELDDVAEPEPIRRPSKAAVAGKAEDIAAAAALQ